MDNVQRKVDEAYPGVFRFDLRKDKDVTGRLEITICTLAKQADKITVHSKLNGDGYPESNWISFMGRLGNEAAPLGIKLGSASEEAE